jgi:L-threonylcarbamoyladenylate synthase
MRRRPPECLRIHWPAGADNPPPATLEALERAARLIRRGRLVAIPTETVYGLAAHALDPEAVSRIFAAKGRPATNPLIVHVSDAAAARSLAAVWPDVAERLAAAFWPGPLSLVVPRTSVVPAIVTAGGPTVAIRCPAAPLVRRLIELTGGPLAAPSANRSEAVSPTTAAHVLAGLGDRVDLVLDAGPCQHGIESTVIDCTTPSPAVLRPGPITRPMLEAAIGEAVVSPRAVGKDGQGTAMEMARSPGQQLRHYAPATPLEITAETRARVEKLLESGLRVGWLSLHSEDEHVRRLAASPLLMVVPMPEDAGGYARHLYAILHALDQRGLDRIIVDSPPEGAAWAAVWDRLSRAAVMPPEPGFPAGLR